MRHVRNLVLGAVATINCVAAWGQACYTPVASMQGNYSLSESASGITCAAGTAGSCNISESSAANVNVNPITVSCSSVVFYGVDSVTSLSLSASDAVKCPPPTGPRTVTIQSTPGGSAASQLTITPTSSTYIYQPAPLTNLTITDPGCGGGGSTTNTTGPLYPQPPAWPFTLTTLPPNVQPLTTNLPFLGQDNYFIGTESWQLSLTLDPVITDCKPCKETGGQGVPVSSTISSQNQSLGEDIAVVGTGFHLHYESDRAPGSGASGIAIADAAMLGGWTLSVHHAFDPGSHTLYLGDGGQRNGYQLGTPLTLNGDLLVTSGSGSEVYVFDLTNGHHLQTLRSLTGSLEYQFGYDAAGVLVTVTDASGNVTTIKRDAATEHPTAIVGPFGQTTTLSVDANGFLSQATDPLGTTSVLVNTSSGLLSSRTDQNGNIFNYTYDSSGRLTKDADPLGGFTQLNRTEASSGLGWTADETTSMGRSSSHQDMLDLPWIQDGTQPESEQHLNTWPDGLQAGSSSNLQNGEITDAFDLPDGTSVTDTLGPDPVWGLQAPVYLSGKTMQGNLTMNTTGSTTATLGTAGDPFTVTTETSTKTVNGRAYTSTFTGTTRTWVSTSPVGRTVTIGLDSSERIAHTQVAGLTASNYVYDTHGRLASITQGMRKTTFSYNAQGFLSSVTDPLTHQTSFTYDADGRILDATLPDGRIVAYAYDANGNLTSETPPGKAAHTFALNAVDLPDTYSPPVVTGTGPTTYTYNLDRDLTVIARPDGKTITYGYDTAGRLASITTPTGKTTYTYSSTTGNLTGAAKGTEHIAYSYNGRLLSKSTWSGPVTGSVSRTYNDNFWIAAELINGANTVSVAHDNDGLTTKVGALVIHRNAKNGLITSTTLGVTTDTRTYNGFGELIGYTATANGTPIYSVQYTRDADSRVASKTETINGTNNAYSYSFDLAGRLSSATKNATNDTYTYDSNANRLTGMTASGNATGTYDAQDRMLTYGNASFTYTANGELTSQTVSTQKTSYVYDLLGNLTAATLPNGTKLAYVVDAENRRVGREVNGILEAGFLYEGDRIVAQLNGSNQLVSQFVYGTGATSPDYMVSGGITYRIFSDQLGSPVLVVNTATGAIAEQVTYDEFGNVLSDSSPGFQPFGFAGGLYDQDTKLVRFGARDYNAAVGRWTAKDPIRFGGNDTNLYGYAAGDPINRFDPTGLGSITISFYSGIGGGITIAYADGHLSAGFEIGVGEGTSIEVNPNTTPFQGDMLTDSQATLFLQGTGRFGVCRFKAGVQSTEQNNDGQFGTPEGVGQVCVGPLCTGTSGDSVRVPTSTSPDQGIGLQGKGGVKVVFPIR